MFVMKGLLKNALLAVLLIQSAFLFSCRKDDPDTVDPASVKLQLKSTTTTSITFSVVPENAVSFSYAVAKSGEIGNAEFITVESGDSTEITVSSLEPQTNYTVAAKAVNEVGQESETVTVEALTTSEASIAIELLEAGSKSVKFKVSPLNAARYGYACVPTAEAETCELNEVGDGEVAEYEIKDLVPASNYTIVAQAFSASGEESKRVYRAFRTEVDPYVELGEVTVSDVDANVAIVTENVQKLYYTLVKSGEQPSEDAYKVIDMKENPVKSLSFFELEPETGYTVYMYGENINGYCGEPVSKEMTTLAESESDLKMAISDVTSLDAMVTMTFNTEVYSKVCWIADTPEAIPDPSAFNWDEAINQIWTARTVWDYESGTPFSIANSFSSRLAVKPAMTIRVGCVPRDAENNILVEKAIWKDVMLEDLIFGASDAAVEMEITKTSHRGLDYSVSSNGANGYYYSIGLADMVNSDIEAYIAQYVLKSEFVTDFSIKYNVDNLEIGKDYVFVAVPADAQGRFGNYYTKEFSTKPVNTDGKGVVNTELVETNYTYLKFDCTLDENTVRLYWHYFKSGTEDEQTATNTLLSSFDYVTDRERSVYVARYVECDTDYEVWFCAEDEDGNLSPIQKETYHTKAPLFDGTGNVEVKTSLSGTTYYIDIKPDENVGRYWYGVIMESMVNDFGKDTWFINQIMSVSYLDEVTGEPVYGNTPHTGEYNGSGSCWGSNYIILIAEDKDGRTLPIVKHKIE